MSDDTAQLILILILVPIDLYLVMGAVQAVREKTRP